LDREWDWMGRLVWLGLEDIFLKDGKS
jgi:hypothetical protein